MKFWRGRFDPRYDIMSLIPRLHTLEEMVHCGNINARYLHENGIPLHFIGRLLFCNSDSSIEHALVLLRIKREHLVGKDFFDPQIMTQLASHCATLATTITQLMPEEQGVLHSELRNTPLIRSINNALATLDEMREDGIRAMNQKGNRAREIQADDIVKFKWEERDLHILGIDFSYLYRNGVNSREKIIEFLGEIKSNIDHPTLIELGMDESSVKFLMDGSLLEK